VPVSLLENALNDFGAAIQLLQRVRNSMTMVYLTNKPWLNAMAGITNRMARNKQSVFRDTWKPSVNYEDSILSQRVFPIFNVFWQHESFLRDRLQMISTVHSYHICTPKIFWFQMQGIYELSDGLETCAVGTNLFGGEPVSPFYGHFSFSHFRQNSFLFSRIAYYF
jgi:hypothetical protein